VLQPRQRTVLPAIVATLAAALAAAALAGCGEVAVTAASPAATQQQVTTAPATVATAPPATTPGAPPPAAPQVPRTTLVVPHGWRLLAELRRPTLLRARPGGRVLARLSTRTAFHSPVVLPVLRRRRGWYAVLSPALPDRRVGWISAHAALRLYMTDYRIDVSLRDRRVAVRRGDQVIERFPVAVGAPGTPTPTGRFAITDKLLTNNPAGPYGCCVLALSGHQPHTPQGWGGGDRIAIHSTDKPGTIGQAASLGCLRAPEYVMRRLVQEIPLGTVVTIRA
jgi:lipoprotein-anchoring transpeptidase ErfK/SrfK